VEPKDEQFYDQLIGHLAAKGKVKEDAGQAVLVISEFASRPLPPLHLHVTPTILGDHMRATATAATGDYPDLHPMEAAWWLFIDHLEEAVQGAATGETKLFLDDTRVVAQPPAA